ncbi:peptidase S24 [Vibrio mimicus]|nr:peptidase S24 [Vibrio mimicus]
MLQTVEAMIDNVIVANFNGEFVCKCLDILVDYCFLQMKPAIHDFDPFSIEDVVISSFRFH